MEFTKKFENLVCWITEQGIHLSAAKSDHGVVVDISIGKIRVSSFECNTPTHPRQ